MSRDENLSLKFGKRVRELRLAAGISQEDFAAQCGLDRTYISSIERGHRNVSLKNIAAIASALNMTLTTLFEGINIDNETR